MAGRPAPAPPLPRAWRQLPRLSAVPPGRLLLNFLDRNDEAEVALQAAIRLAPAHPGVLCNYAGFLHTTRLDFDGADRHYRMALAAKPDHVQTLSCYGSFKMRVTEEFEEAKVPLWVDLICDGCMKSLTELNKPFKYIVSCIIMQRNGAGIHTAQSCHWDIRSVPLLHVACPS